jgi:hypothetical protein
MKLTNSFGRNDDQSVRNVAKPVGPANKLLELTPQVRLSGTIEVLRRFIKDNLDANRIINSVQLPVFGRFLVGCETG